MEEAVSGADEREQHRQLVRLVPDVGLEAAGVDQHEAPPEVVGLAVDAVSRDAGAVLHEGLTPADHPAARPTHT